MLQGEARQQGEQASPVAAKRVCVVSGGDETTMPMFLKKVQQHTSAAAGGRTVNEQTAVCLVDGRLHAPDLTPAT